MNTIHKFVGFIPLFADNVLVLLKKKKRSLALPPKKWHRIGTVAER